MIRPITWMIITCFVCKIVSIRSPYPLGLSESRILSIPKAVCYAADYVERLSDVNTSIKISCQRLFSRGRINSLDY
jgi:hypothetical protein